MYSARSLSLAFAAGAFGGLISSLVMWFCGEIGIMDHYHIRMHPQLTCPWLYQQVIWGGLWGLLFTFPVMEDSYFMRGLVLSAVPTLATLFIIYPILQDQGIMGSRLGDLTWAATAGIYAIWGLSAALWLKWSGGR